MVPEGVGLCRGDRKQSCISTFTANYPHLIETALCECWTLPHVVALKPHTLKDLFSKRISACSVIHTLQLATDRHNSKGES